MKQDNKHTFKKGDKIVYPSYGVGEIEDISYKKIGNKRRRYYVIKLINSDMKIMLTEKTIEESGIRHIISKREADKVLKILREDMSFMENDWKVRYQLNIEKVKKGDIKEMAEMIKNLYLRNKEKELSSLERKLYENAYETIVYEIMLAKNINKEEAENLVAEALSRKGER